MNNVVAYLGRYTHKIAITTNRIKSISEHSVLFTWRDYAHSNQQKEMHLSHAEFLRRFELHILPRGFVKIRHYGLLQNHGKITRLNAIRQQLHLSPLRQRVQVPVSILMLEKYGKDITLCPKCQVGKLELICIDYGRSSANAGLGLLPLQAVLQPSMHHHNQLQSLRNKEKVLITDTKNKLRKRVREAVCSCQKISVTMQCKHYVSATLQAVKRGRRLLSLL